MYMLLSLPILFSYLCSICHSQQTFGCNSTVYAGIHPWCDAICVCWSETSFPTSALVAPTGSGSAVLGLGLITTTINQTGLYTTSAGGCGYTAAAQAGTANTLLNCPASSPQICSSLSSSSQVYSPASTSTQVETWAIVYVPSSTPTAAFCLEGTSTQSALTPLQTCGPSTSSLTASANCQAIPIQGASGAIVSASSYDVCACGKQWGSMTPISSALPILSSMGASCGPGVSSGLPVCHVTNGQSNGLTCDCNQWLAENSNDSAPINNPCAGYVIEPIVSATCHQTLIGQAEFACSCAGISTATARTFPYQPCPVSTTWTAASPPPTTLGTKLTTVTGSCTAFPTKNEGKKPFRRTCSCTAEFMGFKYTSTSSIKPIGDTATCAAPTGSWQATVLVT